MYHDNRFYIQIREWELTGMCAFIRINTVYEKTYPSRGTETTQLSKAGVYVAFCI